MSTARTLTLQGGCNFRDLGGYRTRDGRQTAWGKVFRTGVLSYLTADDHTCLNALQVRAICDLRRADERTREPTRWPGEATQHLYWDDGDSPPTIRSLAAHRSNDAAGMHTAMLDLYRALPAWMMPRVRGMFDRLANNEVPIVVHCAAGKDRTGIAVAVLLEALHVPREIITEDYLLTNATDFEQFILQQHNTHLGVAVNAHPLLTLPDEIRQVIFAADAAYLESAFEQIDRDYGSVEGYLFKAGIDTTQLMRVREILLTAV